MIMVHSIVGGLHDNTASLITWLITAYAVTIYDNNDPDNKDNRDET